MPRNLKVLSLPLSLLAAAALAACATQEAATPQAPVATSGGTAVTTASGGVVTSSADNGRIVVVPATPVVAGTAAPAARPGYGIVEAVSLVYQAPLPSAAAGGTAPAVPGPYRLLVRMDDGTVQDIVQDYRGFLVGDRVQVTADGRILRN
jgi:hypothetical protein